MSDSKNKILPYLTANIFQRIILRWFDRFGRKDLPWQKNKTPYRVWISEIMLQQTQVSTVIPYFKRFVAQFPNVETLANADEDTVLHFWSGLGYYHRARHLHSAAKKIISEFNNQFPNEPDELEALPGIGRSTAGAILSIAFGKKAAILDGNVKRVLTRLHGIIEWPGEKKVTDTLWTLAENYTPKKRCADYTQAIMDLGATLCVRGKPQCAQCPFESYCIARAKNIEKILPKAKPRKTLPIREVTLLILHNNMSVLLEKRPPIGVWAGLWSLPELTGKPSAAEIKTFCQKRFKVNIQALESGASFRHTFSHYHLEITPVFLTVHKTNNKIVEDKQQIWYKQHQSQRIGMPAPIKMLLNKLENTIS